MLPELNIGYSPNAGVTREIVVKYNMGIEVVRGFEEVALAEAADLAYSVHMPWSEPGIGRLNYAATDPDFRRLCMEMIEGRIVFAAENFPSARLVVIHGAPYRWVAHEHAGGRIGDYELFISALRELADFSAEHGLLLTLENNNAYWVNAAGEFSWEDGVATPDMRYFGCTPEHWLAAYDDAGHENFKLCLDTAHACTYAHTFEDHAQRPGVLLSYLERPEAIGHVHWNGHELFEPEGRLDKHLNVGKGTIPIEVHRKVKNLGIPVVLEHFHGEAALVEELAYIAAL